MSEPYDEAQVLAFVRDAIVLFEQAHAVPDETAGVWVTRMQFDAITMGYPASRAKHLQALADTLKGAA